jgi:hypothetical protein
MKSNDFQYISQKKGRICKCTYLLAKRVGDLFHAKAMLVLSVDCEP